MAVELPRLHRYTYGEYLALEHASTTKHEFLRGEIYAMAGGTPLHAALSMAVGNALSSQLTGSGCRPYSSDLRVRVQATGLATYPDFTIVCDEVQTTPEDPMGAINPRVVVEVLSDSTEDYDRGEKLAQYKTVPSLGDIVIVWQRQRRVEVWSRRHGEWSLAEAMDGESVSVPSINAQLDVRALYDSAGAPPTAP